MKKRVKFCETKTRNPSIKYWDSKNIHIILVIKHNHFSIIKVNFKTGISKKNNIKMNNLTIFMLNGKSTMKN